MGWLAVIAAACAVALLAFWYIWFARFNRQRGLGVLRWVEGACAERGRVTHVWWAGPTRLLAELRFPPHMFEHARVIIRLLPRPVPLNWALARWHKDKETLTFEADLDVAPRFHLEVHHHRWSGNRGGPAGSEKWLVTRPGPVLLTSRSQWERDQRPAIHALMAARETNFARIRFSPDSPHLSAVLAIDSLPNQPADARWLEALRELAAGASTSRH